jgi:hypothetical protein
MRAKDAKAWRLLMQARTARNNVMRVAAPQGEDYRPLLRKLGWTENEIRRAQKCAKGELEEGIRALLREDRLGREPSEGKPELP